MKTELLHERSLPGKSDNPFAVFAWKTEVSAARRARLNPPQKEGLPAGMAISEKKPRYSNWPRETGPGQRGGGDGPGSKHGISDRS